MKNEIIRVVDNVRGKFIAVFVKGKGRVVIREGEKYPSGGLAGMTKTSFAAALKAALGEATK